MCRHVSSCASSGLVAKWLRLYDWLVVAMVVSAAPVAAAMLPATPPIVRGAGVLLGVHPTWRRWLVLQLLAWPVFGMVRAVVVGRPLLPHTSRGLAGMPLAERRGGQCQHSAGFVGRHHFTLPDADKILIWV